VRTPGQSDRDRVLYTSAFRRLAGVTQVVGPLEGHIFHNRLTHTIEVAQIARRLAERLRELNPAGVAEFGGLDPDVVEAAALAHDLGHPPFGHVAEKTLDMLARRYDADDGFEGNAQSFRIVTRLSAHRKGYTGLNLTRATLNAILKYPWFRGEGPAAKREKFGAYRTEAADFSHAREGASGQRQSLEAAIMDHADAIAYSVHDLDDFFRAGLIPLETVRRTLRIDIDRFKKSGKVPAAMIDRNRKAIERMFWFQLEEIRARYEGTYSERVKMRSLNSSLINLFVTTVKLGSVDGTGSPLDISEDIYVPMRFLQNLVWRYVITNPLLATQQAGQKHVITTLFSIYRRAIRSGKDGRYIIPPAYRESFEEILRIPKKAEGRSAQETRLVVDIVASFGDVQASALFRRLTGIATGSITDLIGR
jgi:dGTPase